MAKLCPHHQRQIVDAIGFLQTEVKALASSNTQQASNSTSGIQGTACSTSKSTAVTPEKSYPELRFPTESTPKSEFQDLSHSIASSCAMKTLPENTVSLKTSVTSDSVLDSHSPGSGSNQAVVSPIASLVDMENNHHGDHTPLKMKIMTSNVADGKKLSCVLNASLSTHSDSLDDRQESSNPFNRTETQSARLSSSVKRHSQAGHTYQARQKETLGHTKDTPTKLFSVHMTIPSDSPRTARKSIRASSDHRMKDPACRGMVDPDLGHCDIVFIDKPITECFKKQHRSMLPRRNARKSTRGHMYSDEIWELKTVRTLARRGNCPTSMPELITLVTPKQILSKPEGVPPVDMLFVGPCRETRNQQMSNEESDENVIPGTADMVEEAEREVDVIVETSQTDQCQNKGQFSPSLMRSPTENNATDMKTNVEQDTSSDSGTTTGNEESVAQASIETVKNNDTEPQEDTSVHTEQVVLEREVDQVDKQDKHNHRRTTEKAELQLSSDTLHDREPVLQQNGAPSPPSAVSHIEDGREENEKKEIQDEPPQELTPETQMHCNNFEVSEKSNTTSSVDEQIVKEPEIKTQEAVDSVMTLETEESNDEQYDLSSKTLDALLKELPPWRRKKGSVISMPKRLKQTETVIVGYVNGRPISASDRSLRRRSSNSTTSPNKNPVNSSQDVPSKTDECSTDSTTENKNSEKPLPKTAMPLKSIETTVIDQVTEPSSDTPSSPASSPKNPLKGKQIPKQKRVQRDQDTLLVVSDESVDHPQNTESTRQLRSASQKSAVCAISPPTIHAVNSTASPKSPATHVHLPTEQLLSVSPTSPLADTSPPLITPSPTAASEQSQESTETTVELNIEHSQSEVIPSEETQNIEVGSKTQAKQKLRSSKVVDDSKNAKQELVGEVSSSLENQSPVKTEMQAHVLPRSKRILRKQSERIDVTLTQKPNVASLEDRPAIDNGSSTSTSDRYTRMPLRSESSKAEMFHKSVTRSSPVDNKKFALRSQRLAVPLTTALTLTGKQGDLVSPIRMMSERITKVQVKPSPVASVLSQSLAVPVITPRPEPPKHTTNKFLETLTGEESQHLITNMNMKYDKMQKGWVQMDKEGQPATRYKSKADRQAAIWKSKRRTRKPKSSEHQKYSPVQMLFMKSFNLTSICRWFLESTETKSLVIVKKVNTRLPSETQLCFHSSSSTSGTSQGVFPSIQAERLKKHLKKFAIASPVKSNPKSQKLIAKALEQEANTVKGKERRELSSTIQTVTKSRSSAQACIQIGESQKSSGKSKNPASARILRKYSNIREKMQVQQTNARLKKVSKTLKTSNIKRLATTKSTARSSLKAQKSALRVSKQMKVSAAKMVRRRVLNNKKNPKHPVQERGVKAQSNSRASRDATKKELPKRCSQRLGSPKTLEHNPKSKGNSTKLIESQKAEMEKPSVNKMNASKVQAKELPQSAPAEIKGTENAVETPEQSTEVKVSTSPDQILTRSQRKMEAAVPSTGSPSHASKRAAKPVPTQNASPKSFRKAEEPALTRSGALKCAVKRSRAALLPRSASKRAQEHFETPAKRTRTSLLK